MELVQLSVTMVTASEAILHFSYPSFNAKMVVSVLERTV